MQMAAIVYAIELAQGSIHQLEGLSAALLVLGHPELARIADLVHQKNMAASHALRDQQELFRRSRKQAVLSDLKILTRMAGHPGVTVAIRAWRRVVRI